MAMRSNGLAGMKLEHTVLQRDELSGLAALFASNWDGIPQSSRLEAASRVAALRQERLSLESAARRRAELASYESQARVMGMERRLVELRAGAARRASGGGVGLEPPVAARGDVDTRAQLEAARARFAEYVEEVAPRVTGERVDASVQLVEQLRRKRQEVEARRQLAQAEFARQLELEREAEEERERLRQALQVESEDKAKLREVLSRPRPSRQYYEPLQPQDVEMGWEEEDSAAPAPQADAPREPPAASAAPAVRAGGGGAAGPVATSRVVLAGTAQGDEARDAATDMESKVPTVATSGAMPDRSMVHSERSGSPRQPAACQLSSEGTAITTREANAPPNRMHLDAFDVKTSVHIEQTGGACHVYLSGSRCDSASSRIDAPAEAAHTSERWTMTDSAREEQPREEQPRQVAVGKGGGEPAAAEPSREAQQLAMLQVQVQLQQLAVLQSLQQHRFFRSSPTPPPWHGGGPGERQAEAEARQLEDEWARLEEERERLAARRGLRPSWPPYGGVRIDHEVRRSADSLAAERSRLEAERAQLATADANAEARRTHDGLTPSAQRPRCGAAPFVRDSPGAGSGARPVNAASLDATLGDAWKPLGSEGEGDAPPIRAARYGRDYEDGEAEEQPGRDDGAPVRSQGARGASTHSAAGAEWEAPAGPRVVEHGTLSDWEEDEFSSERDDAVGWEEKARQAARQKAMAEAEAEDRSRRAEEARAAEAASRKAEMEAARKREQEAAEREDYERRLAAAREEERRIEQAQLEAERDLARMAEEERVAAEAEEKARRELEEAEAAQRETARVAAEREAAERARQAAEEEAPRQAEERAARKAAEVARQTPPSELEIAPLARALQKRCELSSRGDAKAIVQAWRSLSAEVPKQLDSRAAASWRQDAAMGLYALSVGECAGALRALVISRGSELVPPEVLAKHDPPELHHLREHLSPTDWSLLVILLCHLHFSAKAANLSRSEECTLLLPSLLHGSPSSGGATSVAQFLDSILPPVGAPAPDWMLTGELEGFAANEREKVPDATGNASDLISPIDSLPSSPGFESEEKHADFSSDLHVAESGEYSMSFEDIDEHLGSPAAAPNTTGESTTLLTRDGQEYMPPATPLVISRLSSSSRSSLMAAKKPFMSSRSRASMSSIPAASTPAAPAPAVQTPAAPAPEAPTPSEQAAPAQADATARPACRPRDVGAKPVLPPAMFSSQSAVMVNLASRPGMCDRRESQGPDPSSILSIIKQSHVHPSGDPQTAASSSSAVGSFKSPIPEIASCHGSQHDGSHSETPSVSVESFTSDPIPAVQAARAPWLDTQPRDSNDSAMSKIVATSPGSTSTVSNTALPGTGFGRRALVAASVPSTIVESSRSASWDVAHPREAEKPHPTTDLTQIHEAEQPQTKSACAPAGAPPSASTRSSAAAVAMRYTADSSMSSEDFDMLPAQQVRPATLTSRRSCIPALAAASSPALAALVTPEAPAAASGDIMEQSFGSDSFGESFDLALPE